MLPCPCPPCRCNPSNRTTCVYNNDRDFKTNIVSLKVMKDDDDNDPNGINKLTVPQLKEELLTRGLSIIGNKTKLKAQLVQYLENEEDLDDDEMNEPDVTFINRGTTDATVANSDATAVYQSRTTDATVISGGIAGATVIDGDNTVTSQACTINATITNGGTANATVFNSDATDVYQFCTTDATVVSGGIADATVVNSDATAVYQSHTNDSSFVSGGITNATVINGDITISSQ